MQRVLVAVASMLLLVGAIGTQAWASEPADHPEPISDSIYEGSLGVGPGDVRAAAAPPIQPVIVSVGSDAPPMVDHAPEDSIVGGATHTDGSGWFATSLGAVRPYGGAAHHGHLEDLSLNQPVVAMAATPTGDGYWLVSSDGGIFAYGDATFHGSTGGIVLARPIVDIAAAPDGAGYLLAADDGGVFAFGSAGFHGSMGAVRLNEPIVGISVSPTGNGYWLVARDGGIFAFGDARFHGSTGHRPGKSAVVDVVAPSTGDGYWLVAEDGDVTPFGDAPAIALPDSTIAGTVVAAVEHGGGLWFTVHPSTPTVYAWQSGGLTAAAIAGISQAVDNSGGFTSLTHLGTLGVHDFLRDGVFIQHTTPGWRIAFTARAVDPSTAGAFHGADVAAALQRGHVVMSRRSADLRGARVGDEVVFSGWDGLIHRRTIGAVVPDARVSSTELTFGVEDAASFGFDRPSSIWITGVDDFDVLDASLAEVATTETWVRWSHSWDPANPDSVLSTVRLKELLGEFEYRYTSGVFIEIDPDWVESNIVLAELPLLGRWRCHRAVVPDLVAALTQIQVEGLSDLIDARDSRHGGCWVARRIRGASGGAISRHAWGLAVDINPSTNQWGEEPLMDPRVVEIFRANGFAWGGTWTRPDGMHFEWVGR